MLVEVLGWIFLGIFCWWFGDVGWDEVVFFFLFGWFILKLLMFFDFIYGFFRDEFCHWFCVVVVAVRDGLYIRVAVVQSPQWIYIVLVLVLVLIAVILNC